ncbi:MULTISPECIES: hypothetical protein [Burkholderia]|uniref:hypothetical protein n=1 Tax=Burkholderia TaxID=32008 RepID=UPI001CF25409|nr:MULTISPECIES: hypothetical protein [Burkholderia]MCA8106602.1 hypothetical protein [Burkholderia sp. AU36459]
MRREQLHRGRERLAARGGLGPARLADRELARFVAAFAGLTAVAPRLPVARPTLLRLPMLLALLIRAAIVSMAVAMLLLPVAVLLIALALLLLSVLLLLPLLVLAFALVRVFVLAPGLERVLIVRPFVSRCFFALRLRRARRPRPLAELAHQLLRGRGRRLVQAFGKTLAAVESGGEHLVVLHARALHLRVLHLHAREAARLGHLPHVLGAGLRLLREIGGVVAVVVADRRIHDGTASVMI